MPILYKDWHLMFKGLFGNPLNKLYSPLLMISKKYLLFKYLSFCS